MIVTRIKIEHLNAILKDIYEQYLNDKMINK
jgi:hypothetical protein